MKVKAWNNGSYHADGNGYGVKIDANDRDVFFRREWKTIQLELDGETLLQEINIDKASFWGTTCRELISVSIGKWLIKNGLAPWGKGEPPLLTLSQVEDRRFRLTRLDPSDDSSHPTANKEGDKNVTANDNQVVVVGDNAQVTIKTVVHRYSSDKEQRNAYHSRRNVLQRVKTNWIDGVLDRSPYREAWIELGLELQPEALEYPWDMHRLAANRDPETLPRGIKMIDVFDKADCALLILGEPGSGKTTMLLELARQLIEQALHDYSQPIPVIFELSSWTPTQTFASWIVNKLLDIYHVPKKVADAWIKNYELLILLDGLDDVKSENIDACVQAINAFRDQHPVSIAVCSRAQTLEDLKIPLRLYEAVLIQPLKPWQVSEHLRMVGRCLNIMDEMEAILQLVECDRELQEFTRTPLILSVLVLTYKDLSPEAIKALAPRGDFRNQLFDRYIQRMFDRYNERHKGKKLFTQEDTTKWLAWLSCRMRDHGHNTFYIADIQPSWMNHSQEKLPKALQGCNTVFSIGILIGLLIGLAVAIRTGIEANWKFALFGIALGVDIGIFVGLLFSIKLGLIDGMVSKLGDIRPLEKLDLSSKKILHGLESGVIAGTLVGIFVWLPDLLLSQNKRISSGLIIGLLAGLIVGFARLISERSNETVKKDRMDSYQTINTSLVNCFSVGFAVGAFVLLGVLFVSGILLGAGEGLKLGLFFGSVAGLVSGMYYGGFFILIHFYLRFSLNKSNLLPWKLIPFLNYCTDLVFLRRVLGGYNFIHRMLLEHFAEMYNEGKAGQEQHD